MQRRNTHVFREILGGLIFIGRMLRTSPLTFLSRGLNDERFKIIDFGASPRSLITKCPPAHLRPSQNFESDQTFTYEEVATFRKNRGISVDWEKSGNFRFSSCEFSENNDKLEQKKKNCITENKV